MPIFNEVITLPHVLVHLKKELDNLNLEAYEIITVNDGSNDASEEILKNTPFIKLLNHPYNKGYGAALKTGILAAKFDWVLLFDADGQHQPEEIKKLLSESENYDLISGDRTQGNYVRPTVRKPGIWLLKLVANYLVNKKIPDLNCGLRLIKKEAVLNYIHFLPDGFSFSTTSNLAFLKDHRNVKFVPVTVNERDKKSKSMVRPRDAFNVLMLIFRLIMLFSPLRIFIPLSLIMFLFGTGIFIYDLTNYNVSEITVFTLISALLIFLFGLIADQLAAVRREINKK